MSKTKKALKEMRQNKCEIMYLAAVINGMFSIVGFSYGLIAYGFIMAISVASLLVVAALLPSKPHAKKHNPADEVAGIENTEKAA